MSRSTVSVSKETKRMLDALKHEGQSYDGVIQELAEERLSLSDEAMRAIDKGIEDIRKGRGTRWKELKE